MRHSLDTLDPIFLTSCPLFDGLTGDARTLAPLFEKQHYPDKQVIVQQGHVVHGLYIIHQGQASVTLQILGEGRSTLGILHSPQHFGELAILTGGKAAVSINAMGDLNVYYLSIKNMAKLAIIAPEIAFRLKKNLTLKTCTRIRYIHEVIKKSDSNYEIPLTLLEKSSTIDKQHIKTHSLLDGDTLIPKYREIMLRLHFFRELDEQELITICRHAQCISAPQSTALFKEHHDSPCFYLPLLGAVQGIMHDERRFSKLALFGPGSSFGQLGFFDEYPRMVSALLREESLLLRFDQNSMDAVKQDSPDLWYKLHDLLFSDLAALIRRIEQMYIRLFIQSKGQIHLGEQHV